MPYKDKEKQRESNRRSYLKYPKAYALRAKKRRNENRRNMFEYLKRCECKKCGEKDWRVLEFDHLDVSKKTNNISRMVTNRISWVTILKELDNCQCLCSNCHKKKTANEQGWYKEFLDS